MSKNKHNKSSKNKQHEWGDPQFHNNMLSLALVLTDYQYSIPQGFYSDKPIYQDSQAAMHLHIICT